MLLPRGEGNLENVVKLALGAFTGTHTHTHTSTTHTLQWETIILLLSLKNGDVHEVSLSHKAFTLFSILGNFFPFLLLSRHQPRK